ncbi:PAS domain S-box protein [Desulfovibrio sp. UCD-KL4C]|uniref:PAS domain-containing sensor histidine kinase n=1 Tax=Desulfovibrio sp. UCD-KL4C TaxID=2578120 RepID=UPI0025C42FA6|nr:PAS domain S-box protein [Desulfovibrio sp. UCD-KL4C]
MIRLKEISGRHLMYAFILLTILLWIGESLFEFLWFNPKGEMFLANLFPFHNHHEMFMRGMSTVTLLVCGYVVSRMYSSLTESERKARIRENNLRITFNSIGDAVVTTDGEGHVAFMNPVSEILTGWSFVEAKGLEFKKVVNVLSSNSAGISNPINGVLRSGEGKRLSNHTILISKQGNKYHIANSIAPIRNEDGEISGAVFVFKDVSEKYRKDSEFKSMRIYLSNIIDSMPSILLGVNGDGQVTLWNRAAEQETGISPKSAYGRNLFEVFPRMKTDIDRIFGSIRSKDISRNQRKIRYSESGICYEDVTIFPLISDSAEGAVVRVDDVTELIKLEQAMIQNEKMMSVGALASGMAHEVNNPLAAISGHAQNISNRIFGDLKKNEEVAAECDVSLSKVREYMDKRAIPRMLDGIYSSCSHAAKIVNDMIMFSRRSDSNQGRHSLVKLLDDTLGLAAVDYDLSYHYDFRKIEIIREYDRSVPDIYCEGSEIQQVFLNILKNGAQSMMEKEYHDGHPCFTLRIHAKEEMAVVEIEDNGQGMDEEVLKRIFEPFYSTKKVARRSGLGLSVSYFVVTDLHNGSMEAYSVYGSWARFIIKLPLNVDM